MINFCYLKPLRILELCVTATKLIDRGAGEAEVIKTGMVLPWCSLHSGRDRCYLLHFTAEEMRPGEVRIKSLT